MYEVFKKLCEERGWSVRYVALKTNIAPSTFTDWKHGTKIRPDKIKKIADFLNVSVDYLMTGEGKEKSSSTEEEDIDAALIEMLKKLDPSQVQRVKDFVAGIQAK